MAFKNNKASKCSVHTQCLKSTVWGFKYVESPTLKTLIA